MLFAAGKNGAPAVDFRRKIQYTVGVIGDRKPGEQGKRATGRTSTKLNISGCSAVGSALALGARCRVFESPHSDQKEKSAPGAGFLRGKRGGAGRRSGGGCSEAEHAPRSKKSSRRIARGFFREPKAGRAKQAGRKVNNCARIVGAKLNISGCSAVGSALALGARCRVFESPHSDQVMMIRAA